MPLVLQVYFWDHTRPLKNPNKDTQSQHIKYHSDVLIRSIFRICSPNGHIVITLPPYQLTNSSDRAECKYDVYNPEVGSGGRIAIVND